MKPFLFPLSIPVIPKLSHFAAVCVVLAGGGQAVSAQSPQPAEPDQPEQELLHKDFKPTSMLQVAEHPVEKARFPVIDFHGHLRRMDSQDTLRVMDACNVQTIIDFDGGSGPAFEGTMSSIIRAVRTKSAGLPILVPRSFFATTMGVRVP